MVEIIGFIISLLALIYLFFKQQSINRYRQEHPEAFIEEEIEEDDPLKEFMKAIERQKAAREASQHVPPPPPKMAKQSKQIPLYPSLEDYRMASQIENRQLKSSLENRRINSKLGQRFEELPSHTLAPNLHYPGSGQLVGQTRVGLALKRLSKKQDLIIYQEIIDKPRGLRPH